MTVVSAVFVVFVVVMRGVGMLFVLGVAFVARRLGLVVMRFFLVMMAPRTGRPRAPAAA